MKYIIFIILFLFFYNKNYSQINNDTTSSSLMIEYNVLTPNNDGINDVLMMNNNEISKLIIFDRWSNEIYSSEGIDIQWYPDTELEWCLLLDFISNK